MSYNHNSKDKYKFLTQHNDVQRIISTCLAIMDYFLAKNPYASFGFIGANSIGEQKSNTKRFMIYQRIIKNVISPITFSHYLSEEKSAYLIFNKLGDVEQLKAIQGMFKTIFDLYE